MAGQSPASVTSLRKKLEKFEEGAKAIRLVLEMLGEDATESAEARADATMREALKLDATRRNGNGPGRPRHEGGPTETEYARRERIAVMLDDMSHTVPQHVGNGASALLMHGYIARKGDGYVRTTKPYPLTREERAAQQNGDAPKRKQAKYYTPKEAARRQQTAAILATMSRTVPKPYPGRSAHVLVKYGYLVRKANGYIRTAKPYTMTKPSRIAKMARATFQSPSRQPAAAQAAKVFGYSSRAAKDARHQALGAVLAKFDRVTPRNGGGFGRGPMGNLVRQGYLRAKGDGYIRTAKPFPARWIAQWEKKKKQKPVAAKPTMWITRKKTKRAKPEERKKNTGTYTVNKQAQRARSAAFLDLFGPTTPTMPPVEQFPPGFPQKGLGPLVRRGYLTKVGDGYIRTDKVFDVKVVG